MRYAETVFAAAEQQRCPTGDGARTANCGGQARLAGPWLTGQQHHRQLSAQGAGPGGVDPVPLGGAADEREVGVEAERGRQFDLWCGGGVPADLPRQQRERQPFVLPRTVLDQILCASVSGKHTDDIGDQDLAGQGGAAQAGSLDDRRTLVVAVGFDADIARRQTDSKPDLVFGVSIAVADQGLDLGSGDEPWFGAVEGRHEAVTERLDDLATVAVDRGFVQPLRSRARAHRRLGRRSGCERGVESTMSLNSTVLVPMPPFPTDATRP